jgi:hypothetical protein
VPYNLLQRSEEFDNATWQKAGGTTITANSVTAPNGTLTADTFNASQTNLLWQNLSASNNTTYTLSLWVKLGTATNICLIANNTLSWDTIGGQSFNASNGLNTSTWTRISFTFTTSTLPVGAINLHFGGNSQTGLTQSTGTVFIWGAQLNEGTLKDYFATETRLNIPRIDYSLGSCPSLLVEPQRTNTLTWSEAFDNVAWSKAAITFASDNTISPSGILNADKIISTNVLANHWIGRTAFALTIGTTYSFSVYAKKNGYNLVLSVGSSTIYTNCNFNLTNGTASTPYATLGANLCTATIEDFDNDWYRCTITFNAFLISNALLYSTNSTSTTPIGAFGMDSHLGDGTSGFFLWGAQLEAGAYPTSYIPTTSASVTRNADVISKTGISSLIGQTEGTMFFEGNVLNYSQARRFIVLYQDANNYMSLRVTSGNDLQFLIVSGGATSVNITTANIQGNIKIALAYNNNDFVAYLNGTQVGSDTSGSVPTTSDFYLGCDQSAGNQMAGGIKVSALWKTRLTNAQLAQLTTI